MCNDNKVNFPRMIRRLIFPALVVGLGVGLLPTASVSAAESRGLFCATPTACELQIYVENDILGGTDRYYTSGLKVGGAVGAVGTSFSTVTCFVRVLRWTAAT